jgi:hypothetical protein
MAMTQKSKIVARNIIKNILKKLYFVQQYNILSDQTQTAIFYDGFRIGSPGTMIRYDYESNPPGMEKICLPDDVIDFIVKEIQGSTKIKKGSSEKEGKL